MKKSFLKIVSLFLVLTFSTVVLGADPAQASIKHFIIGGLAGAGLVLAWPTITAAVGCAAGAIGSVAAGIGGAVVAGVGAVGGAVAAGGAAVGGAVAGVGAAAGAGVTAGFGAIGGAIAAITASPLFVPALLIAGALIIGIILYKKWKKGKGPLFGKKLTPSTTCAARTSAGYVPAIAANTAAAAPAMVNSNPTPTATYAPVVSGNAVVSTNIPSSLRADTASAERKPDVANASATGTNNVNAAHEKYVASYKAYINLLSSKKADDPEVQKALSEYKASFEAYQGLLKANE